MIEFKVPGMTCGGCETRVARDLSGVGQDDVRVEIDVAARGCCCAAGATDLVDVRQGARPGAGGCCG